MSHRKRGRSPLKTKVVLGSSMLALVGILTDLKGAIRPPTNPDLCQTVVRSQAVLSRDQLTRLLAIPERSHKPFVTELLREPYCTLPDLEIRPDVVATREAYPLAFDPDTWFIVLYEGNEYVGYDFSFRR